MTDFVPPPEPLYNETHSGFYGEFGTGANTQIFFIQSGLTPAELQKITLIHDIPGSETWSVRDLFQRDVDQDRVSRFILPYFHDITKVKFFSPLILTLLPVDPATQLIIPQLAAVEQREENDGEQKWKCSEATGYYRFRTLVDRRQYGRVDWNTKQCKLVAIDGQHRLSALKRWFGELQRDAARDEFVRWTIPVVIFGLRAVDPRDPHAGRILEAIRRIFVVINSTAIPVNEARRILLSDDSVTCILTQELLEYAHQNDVLPLAERDETRMPLLMFDWRGERASEESSDELDIHLMTIKELHELMANWVVMSKADEQLIRLGIERPSHLIAAIRDDKIGPDHALELRKLFAQDLLPGVAYLLEHFGPYEAHIRAIRDIEKVAMGKSDLAQFAFFELRFGQSRADTSLLPAITALRADIMRDLMVKKQDNLSGVMARAIGMRGIMAAYGSMKEWYDKEYVEENDGTATWLEYSMWFTAILNRVIADGWLGEDDAKRALRLHISHDPSGEIVNYRFSAVPGAIGALMAALVGAYGFHDGTLSEEISKLIWGESEELLRSTLARGYRKQAKLLVEQERRNETATEAKERARALTEEWTNEHMTRLMAAMEGIALQRDRG